VSTLAERTTRYVLLLHLPAERDAYLAGHAIRQAITTRPADLARTIIWDQGNETAYRFWLLLTRICQDESTIADPGGDVTRFTESRSGRAAGRRKTGTPGSSGPGPRRTKPLTC
jgi:hypothetical protein